MPMDLFQLLWLIPALPLLGFLLLAFFGSKMPRSMVPVIGAGSVLLSAIVVILIGIQFLNGLSSESVVEQNLWTWFQSNEFAPEITLHLDALSLVFIFVITFVGFLIHLYSAEFMCDDEGYSRFFAYMNLFICSMLILVLANDLLLLYLGWEGVGLCSFLLIGFWYNDPLNAELNAYAARKSFLVTRIGDTAMILGLFLLVKNFHTLNITTILNEAPALWQSGDPSAKWAAILLLGGAVGKSAQLPLQTWLPDAMAGPSPVSALIHAATMVTAGVYLLARTHVIFELAPDVQTVVAIIGAATLFLGSCSALVQYDIKRVLAYSTISQIGYMFLALGVGAWSAAIFHFMIHAIFKALLFLAAGAVILAVHHEHDMFKMGGLRKRLPVVFWTFLFGAGALASLPLITAGFYSKDEILWFAFASAKGNFWLWLTGFVAAFLTAVYTFRMVFLTFFGTEKTPVTHKPGKAMLLPLIILGVLSLIAGFVELPHNIAGFHVFSDLLHTTLPAVALDANPGAGEGTLQIVTGIIALLGVYLAWQFYLKKPQALHQLKNSSFGASLYEFLLKGWQFDKLYNALIVKPWMWISRVDTHDFIDFFYTGLGRLNLVMNTVFSRGQNGNVRTYLFGIALGAVIVLTLILIL